MHVVFAGRKSLHVNSWYANMKSLTCLSLKAQIYIIHVQLACKMLKESL